MNTFTFWLVLCFNSFNAHDKRNQNLFLVLVFILKTSLSFYIKLENHSELFVLHIRTRFNIFVSILLISWIWYARVSHPSLYCTILFIICHISSLTVCHHKTPISTNMWKRMYPLHINVNPNMWRRRYPLTTATMSPDMWNGPLSKVWQMCCIFGYI